MKPMTVASEYSYSIVEKAHAVHVSDVGRKSRLDNRPEGERILWDLSFLGEPLLLITISLFFLPWRPIFAMKNLRRERNHLSCHPTRPDATARQTVYLRSAPTGSALSSDEERLQKLEFVRGLSAGATHQRRFSLLISNRGKPSPTAVHNSRAVQFHPCFTLYTDQRPQRPSFLLDLLLVRDRPSPLNHLRTLFFNLHIVRR